MNPLNEQATYSFLSALREDYLQLNAEVVAEEGGEGPTEEGLKRYILEIMEATSKEVKEDLFRWIDL